MSFADCIPPQFVPSWTGDGEGLGLGGASVFRGDGQLRAPWNGESLPPPADCPSAESSCWWKDL